MKSNVVVLNFFQKASNRDKILTPEDVAKGTELKVHNVYAALARLHRSGVLVKLQRGQYRLVAKDKMVLDLPGPEDKTSSESNQLAADSDSSRETGVIELKITDDTCAPVILAVSLWIEASDWPDNTIPDTSVVRIATEDGYSILEITRALTLLGAEPFEEHKKHYTRFPLAKLILSQG